MNSTACGHCLASDATEMAGGKPSCHACARALSEHLPTGPDLVELLPALADDEPAVAIVGVREAVLEVVGDLDGRLTDYDGASSTREVPLTDVGGGRYAVIVWSPRRGISIADVVGEVRRAAIRLHYDLRLDAALAREARAA